MMADEERPARSRYEHRGHLGSGSFGTVDRVYDRSRGREVALKRLHGTDGAAIYRFKREFRSLVGLAHPNLVDLYELDCVDDEWLFTMELIDGVRFDQWVRPDPEAPLDRARALDAFGQLADAVLALHHLGKLHRDLKPSNVLVDVAGRVVLLDFGLVSDPDTPEPPATRPVGTAAYMSPEQGARMPLTPASDWYAVGVMLYEALTAQRPFHGRADEVLLRKVTEPALPPRHLVPTVPADLDRLCVRLIDRDPDQRPGGEEVLAALGRAPSAATRKYASPATPRVGLCRDLARFCDLLRQAFVDSRDHAVVSVVLGPAGSGKTRLLESFLAEVRASHAPLVVGGRVTPGDRTPFPVLDAAVDQIGNFVLTLPPLELAAVVGDVLEMLPMFPALARLPLLERLTPLTATELDPDQLEQRAFTALARLSGRLAAHRPVIGWVDDAHATIGRGFQILDALLGPGHHVHLIYLHRSEVTDTPVLRALRDLPDGADVRWLELPAAPA
ncbi:MAG: serine/threonine-protein kinase PknK [Myxococcales bacterium]|nr:serine/threonine-protein kinase PknK [Myxococcales bacterium]